MIRALISEFTPIALQTLIDHLDHLDGGDGSTGRPGRGHLALDNEPVVRRRVDELYRATTG